MSDITVYACVGNSDDKLSQADWSDYAREFMATIRRYALVVYGEWWSESGSRWQNACVGFVVAESMRDGLRAQLAALRLRHRQDSVAWSETPTTELI